MSRRAPAPRRGGVPQSHPSPPRRFRASGDLLPRSPGQADVPELRVRRARGGCDIVLGAFKDLFPAGGGERTAEVRSDGRERWGRRGGKTQRGESEGENCEVARGPGGAGSDLG